MTDSRVYLLQVMQNHAAVFRDGPTLQEGCKKIADLWKELSDLKVYMSVNQHIHN